jgi:hypothetical protein
MSSWFDIGVKFNSQFLLQMAVQISLPLLGIPDRKAGEVKLF